MTPRDSEGLYAALNVSPTASQAEIHIAYRYLRQAFEAGEELKDVDRVREAYKTLGNPTSREEYDDRHVSRASLLTTADGKSRLHSAHLLLVLALMLGGAVAWLFGPELRAPFVSFEAGDTLHWKQTLKPIGTVLAYESDHAFPEGKPQPAYQIRAASGATQWLPANDLHQQGAR